MNNRIALDAKGAAALFGVSERHWRQLDADGAIPMPIRLGKSTRWLSDEVEAWAKAGTPSRLEWERQRTGGGA